MKSSPLVVVCQEAGPLSAILPRLGEGAARALSEGRVFVGARRASHPEQEVPRGAQVILYASRAASDEGAYVLVTHQGIVGAYKPAAMATVADHRGAAGTLEHEIATQSGAASLHPTSRLDVGVSGVVLFAKDDEASAHLARARDEGRYLRHYVAVSDGIPDPRSGTWSAPIGRDRDPRRRRVAGRDPAPAATAFAVAAVSGRAALLAIEPLTGRTHQIRVHAAHAGCALFGDGAYGGPTRIVSPQGSVLALRRIALHAAWVDVPDRGSERLRVEAPIPSDLQAIWAALGGDPDAWEKALQGLC